MKAAKPLTKTENATKSGYFPTLADLISTLETVSELQSKFLDNEVIKMTDEDGKGEFISGENIIEVAHELTEAAHHAAIAIKAQIEQISEPSNEYNPTW